jgi:hypothetical protein
MALAVASAGVANAAPIVVGMTYDKASAAVSNAGLTAVVSTSTGTELQQSDCIVVNQVLRPATSFSQSSTTMLLSLNCNAAIASATQSGNSAASPDGQKAKKEAAAEEWRQNSPDGQKWCAENQKNHPEWDWPSIKGCATT